ncbi:WhiB family transcriptional regulator [Nocardiopsis dassonvillei]|uniref:WhiB family transcriptional regulator n=1 Tax=Nocardiopsis dassonvillei TaxID=2014 RepID=UPI003626CA3D
MSSVQIPTDRQGELDLYTELRLAGLTPTLAAATMRVAPPRIRILETRAGIEDEPETAARSHRTYAAHRDHGLAVVAAADLLPVSLAAAYLGYEPAYQQARNAVIGRASQFAPWDARGVCGRPGIDPTVFEVSPHIPASNAAARAALALCAVCPVRAECLDDAIDTDETDLVRAGLTPREVKAEKRRRRSRSVVAA